MGRRSPKLTPFRQGNLDALCGLYAAINAIRLATASSTHHLTEEDWAELFFALIIEAETAGASHAAGSGIGTKALFRLTKAAARHMADAHGVR